MNNRYEFLTKQIIAEIGKTSPMFPAMVVDCGCGDGFGSSLLAKQPNWVIHAFDFDSKQVAAANARGIQAKIGDIRSLELPSLFADIFVCSETLEHLTKEDSIKAAKEIFRITAAPGVIVITVPADKKICLANKKHKQYLSAVDLEEHFVSDECVKIYQGEYCKTPGRCNLVMMFRKLI